MDEDIAEYALDAARKIADWAEVRFETYQGNSLLWKNGTLENVSFFDQEGLCVRIIIDGAMGFTSTNILTKKSINQLIDQVVKIARVHHRRAPICLTHEKTYTTKWGVKKKKEFPGIEEKIALLTDIDYALGGIENVQACFYQIEDNVHEKFYLNSEGSRILSVIPHLSLFYLLSIGLSGDSQQITRQFGNTGGWEFIGDWNVNKRIVHDAQVLNDLLRKGQKTPQGRVDVVLGPSITGLIAHESCGHPFEADRIQGRESAQAGKSFVTQDMLGQRLGSSHVSIIDDPTLANSYGHYQFDDEGVKAQKRLLIKDGIINTFLHNRETGHLMDEQSNASSRASNYESEPIVRMSNTYLKNGDYTRDELFEDIQLGIYMDSFMEWNIDDTRYNQKYVGSEAYLIQKGELGPLVRQPTLEITTPSLYYAIDALGKDLEFTAAVCGKGDPMQGIPVWTGGPAARLRNIRIT
jgi:TldD protein